MTTNQTVSQSGPDQSLDYSDQGDDIGARFRYQYCYAGLQAFKMIAEDSNIIEVICENHDDILLKRKSGRFVAIQVKTRRLDQVPFKANDESIRGALCRFIKLDSLFPNEFECFEFVTNFQFWRNSDNSNNVCWLLSSLKDRKSVKGLKKDNQLRIWVESFAADTGKDIDEVVSTLLRVNLVERNDNLKVLIADLKEAISQLPSFEKMPSKICIQAARSIERISTDASTMKMSGNVLDLYEVGKSLEETLAIQKLEGKKLNLAKIMDALNESIEKASNIEPITFAGLLAPEEVPDELGVMTKKLTAGDLQWPRIEQLKTLKKSFDHIYMTWARRYGADKANELYQDVMAQVNVECTEAQVESISSSPYASEMYSNLYKRLRNRRTDSANRLHGCSEEHMLGAAAILTEDCKVWWSDKFDLDGGSDEEA